MTRPAAIVTGASRGIGKAVSVALAEAGFDVAITARTMNRSDVTRHPGVDDPLPGSLEETAEAIADAGGVAHRIALDLLDRDQVDAAARACLHALGRVDVLVNNAIFTAGGNDQRFLDADLDLIDRRVEGNIAAQLRFTQPIVAAMVEGGGGTVLNMTSGAGYLPPFAPPGRGGWGMGYSVSKGGFHRIAPQLSYEYADEEIVALNVQPGFVATERTLLSSSSAASRNVAARGVAPHIVGRAVAHVATHVDEFPVGKTVQLQDLAVALGLLDPA